MTINTHKMQQLRDRRDQLVARLEFFEKGYRNGADTVSQKPARQQEPVSTADRAKKVAK